MRTGTTRARLCLPLLPLLLMITACGASDRPSSAGGGDDADPMAAADTAAATAVVPARYQGLIRSEMTRVEPAMQQLLSLIARGNATMGAHVAREIEGTFVLKGSMTPAERQEMAAALPAGFVEIDRQFHHRAGELADRLERGDFGGAVEVYSDMTRACVTCHSRYARHRFPALPAPQVGDGVSAEVPSAKPAGDQ